MLYFPWMGSHVANMHFLDLNVLVASLTSISRRVGNIESSFEYARQLSRAGLMAPSVQQGWWMTMVMGGTCKVLSSPLAPLHFVWVCYVSLHSVQILCFGFSHVVLPPLQIFRSLRVWFISTTMPKNHGKPKRWPSYYRYSSRKRRLRSLA
jgi:hypothetical protein